ncbi:BTB/POZ domain-containing protein At5g47800-like [Momordica charantia]|uniref:BTB/POZ domain-containing protein At5g47800-like n=1 Tax=Momordica charantia TaxID=3673 RepID=A0A6J1CLM4_MOMCH|nr:BTB/POZ domain-containing protein At5g47800-like [Momordica charantia]XP_022142475.1 BTB/POZ domain-containing protein At5g47800-like [Momordica charantia]
MKFMKLGTRPDIFYTEEATRTVISDVPSDLVIRINNITYLIHKFPVVAKCGLLQRLCSNHSGGDGDGDGDTVITIELHDIPGGEDAFELCAKFCYGITINLSAHNFVSAFSAANFLRMTESLHRANFISKLEAFFLSCILAGWKDSIATLRSSSSAAAAAAALSEWSHNLGITTKCIDSVVHKILTPPSKVSWSYTYTRPGYNKKTHRSVPKDWWTEDIADLDIDLFRCVIVAISSTCILPPPLIGEALHVYASRWLPDAKIAAPKQPEEASSDTTTTNIEAKNRQIVETIISLIPPDRESVSVSFSLRLLRLGNLLGASAVCKTEVIRRCSLVLEEATVGDLIFSSQQHPDEHNLQDVDLVVAVLESFLMVWRRQSPVENNGQLLASVRKVGKLIDSYLQVVARDRNMPVAKMVCLAEALPDVARPNHDDMYKAINIFLKEHPDVSKAEKKRLCRVLNCQKLSPEVRAHAVKNERLPLRTVVQVLFFDQDKGSKTSSRVAAAATEEVLLSRPKPKQRPATATGENLSLSRPGPDEKLRRSESTKSRPTKEKSDHDQKMKTSSDQFESRRKVVVKGEGEERYGG